MIGSIAHHHKKGHHLDEEDIKEIEDNGGGGAAVPPHELEQLVRDVDGKDDEEPPPAATTYHDLEQLASLRGAAPDATAGVSHKKGSKEKNYGVEPDPTPDPPAEASTFHDVQALVGLRDATVAITNTGAQHGKQSKEQNYAPPTPPLAPPVVGLLRDAEDSSAAGVDHKKYAEEQDYRPPTPPPTPPPGPDVAVLAGSLRDVHQSSNGAGADSAVSAHHKYSQEQNAQNPDQDPVWQWSTPRPTQKATPIPTEDIRRVNPAFPASGGEGGSSFEQCKAGDGVYFGSGPNAVRNGGVMVRYQYELYEREATGHDLVRDILPALEGGITDQLMPVFFQECLNFEGEGGRRGLAKKLGTKGQQRGSHSLLRQRRLSTVVGIDAKPKDIPLWQQECESDFFASDPEGTQCHRIEGALTLYFPPHTSLHSSVLSSTTLATLRAIEQGMNDGSLMLRHLAIRKLHFLKDSYGLQPGVDPTPEGGVGVTSSDPEGSGKPEDGNLGLVVWILIPLLVLCCCCCLGVSLWKLIQRQGDGDDGTWESSRRSLEDESSAAESRRDREDEYADSGTDYSLEKDADSHSGDHGTTASESYDEFSAFPGSDDGAYDEMSEEGGSAANRDDYGRGAEDVSAASGSWDGRSGEGGSAEGRSWVGRSGDGGSAVSRDGMNRDDVSAGSWEGGRREDGCAGSQSRDGMSRDSRSAGSQSWAADDIATSQSRDGGSTGSRSWAGDGSASSRSGDEMSRDGGSAASRSRDEMSRDSGSSGSRSWADDGSAASRSRKGPVRGDRYDDEYDFDFDGSQEGTRTSPPAAASSNPLGPIFQEAEKERAKKRKARKQRNRVRRRMERMNEATSANGVKDDASR